MTRRLGPRGIMNVACIFSSCQAGQKRRYIEDISEETYAAAQLPSISVSPNTAYILAVWAMSDDEVRE